MVERYIKWVLRNRIVVLTLCALVSALSLTVIKDGVFASSLVKLFLGDSPDYQRFQQLSEEFGSGDLIFIAIEDAAAFSDNGGGKLERVAGARRAGDRRGLRILQPRQRSGILAGQKLCRHQHRGHVPDMVDAGDGDLGGRPRAGDGAELCRLTMPQPHIRGRS